MLARRRNAKRPINRVAKSARVRHEWRARGAPGVVAPPRPGWCFRTAGGLGGERSGHGWRVPHPCPPGVIHGCDSRSRSLEVVDADAPRLAGSPRSEESVVIDGFWWPQDRPRRHARSRLEGRRECERCSQRHDPRDRASRLATSFAVRQRHVPPPSTLRPLSLLHRSRRHA